MKIRLNNSTDAKTVVSIANKFKDCDIVLRILSDIHLRYFSLGILYVFPIFILGKELN